jgi:hypothetical protein
MTSAKFGPVVSRLWPSESRPMPGITARAIFFWTRSTSIQPKAGVQPGQAAGEFKQQFYNFRRSLVEPINYHSTLYQRKFAKMDFCPRFF